ncbi:peptidoglycan-binding domain-containing protein [Xanthomonas theicola]|uniref:Peptidoglycan binding-like domain-containing protein n=1 Tax=Xanthomonas theicola TaxID=56464 RepID=A0A2S6ZJN6_9XANT|nr:peptidoglycan-binding protein [Xanthomonas theicola]PPT92467.1 hypothetical protein XthCFBP4691_03790 [Xanthomonas theicola]QNH26426.1 peptidoglycan-binding protein [Xanthomonas theicola]
MPNINTSDHNSLAGSVYFVVGRGTEGGPSSYRLSIAGVTSGASDPGWGDANNVIANSGYTFGAIQVDLGQRGTWPVGAVENTSLKQGEKTYVDAIIDQSNTYAKKHDLKFTGDLPQLRSDLLSHGNGKSGRSKISFIDEDTRDSINAWAASPEGKQWVHKNIDYPQIKAATETAMSILEKHGKNIETDRHFETINILAKTANQMPSQLEKYKDIMDKGGDYQDVLNTANDIKKRHSYYDAPKAAALAEKYENIYNDPSKKEILDRAHVKVSSLTYDPSKESNDSDIKEALKAVNQSTRTHDQNHPANGVLKLGSHGEAVGTLQADLAALGYTDSRGRPLHPDKDFGRDTDAALRAFQHDHGLEQDGIAGPTTLKAVQRQRHGQAIESPASQSANPAPASSDNDPRNPDNPNHALYCELHRRIPDTSENRLLQFTAACHSNRITADNLSTVYLDEANMKIGFAGLSLLSTPVLVDLNARPPQPEQSIQQIQQYDQQQAQMMAQTQNAQINTQRQ